MGTEPAGTVELLTVEAALMLAIMEEALAQGVTHRDYAGNRLDTLDAIVATMRAGRGPRFEGDEKRVYETGGAIVGRALGRLRGRSEGDAQ